MVKKKTIIFKKKAVFFQNSLKNKPHSGLEQGLGFKTLINQ